MIDEMYRTRQPHWPSEPSSEEYAYSDAMRAFGGILHDQGMTS